MTAHVQWLYERMVRDGIKQARARELALAVLTRKATT